MATPVSSVTPSNIKLEKIFPTLVGDFKQISGNFDKLVKIRKEENVNLLRERFRVRQVAYKSKFLSRLEKRYESKSVSEHASGFLSLLKGIGGALGAAFLALGAAGIAKMILSSEAGSYIGKFIAAAFASVLDLFKKTIEFLSDVIKDSRIKDAFIRAFNSLFQTVSLLISKSFDIVKSLFNDLEIRSALVRTFLALFTAVVYAIEASHAVIKKLFDDDASSIKTNLIEAFSKIVDVFVNVLSVAGDLFKTLMRNDEFLEGLKNIFISLISLVVEAFKYDYKNPKTGERVNILQEVGIIIGEMALLFAASAVLRREFLKAGAAIDRHGLGGGGLPNTPDPPDGKDEKNQKQNRTQRMASSASAAAAGQYGKEKVSAERLKQIADARNTKASWTQRLWYNMQNNGNKLKLLFDKLMYSNTARGRFASVVYRLSIAAGKKFSEAAITRICIAMLASVITASTGVGALVSLVTIIGTSLLAYDIVMFIVEYAKEIADGLDKEETTPIESQTFYGMQGAPTPIDSVDTSEVTPTPSQNFSSQTFTGMKGTDKETAAPITQTPSSPSAQTDKKEGVIYTVGDSHSNGVSNYGRRKGFIAKGKDGSPSTAKMHLNAINSIPEGSNVVISLGANDLADPKRKISSIVGSVTSVIAAAQKRGLNVTYLLPTSPASNKPSDPRRIELREALKAAVKVPIIDLGQASTSDKMGLHLDGSGYSNIASQVSKSFKTSAPAPSPAPTPAPTPAAAPPASEKLPTQENTASKNLSNEIEKRTDSLGIAVKDMAQKSADTLGEVIKDLTERTQVNSETEKKTTIAGLLMSQLSSQLKALDEMTGGKLGTSSTELNEALRYLEDEFNQGTSIFDMSSKLAVHKTETTVNQPANIQKTNQNILNAILKRQYT